MVTRTLEEMLDAIRQNPTEIWAWIHEGTANGVECNRSVKIEQKEAIRWCEESARDKEHPGVVPGFIAEKEVWLGNPRV